MISTGSKIIFDPDNTHFSTTPDLIPKESFNLVEGFRLVVMPLYFRDNHTGIVLFGDGPNEGGIYELLRGQLSSAIMGALLIVQLKEKAKILSKGIEDLTLSLKGMIKTSETIGNNMAAQSSAIEELSRNIKQIVGMTAKSNSLSEEFNTAANKGQSSVNDSVESINTVT